MKKNKIIILIISVMLIIIGSCLGMQHINKNIMIHTNNEYAEESADIDKFSKEVINTDEANAYTEKSTDIDEFSEEIIITDKVNKDTEKSINIENQSEELINIDKCSEEFMNNYFEQSQKLEDENNKENILILTSTEEIKDEFGATKVVEAPNNQYILQYSSEEDKNKALEEIQKVDTTISVEENVVRTITGYNSWGIEKTGLDYAIGIAEEKELNDITVAIIDTGCDMNLFNKNYPGKIEETYNVLNPGSNMVDENGHGTHIAGTIAEATPSNVKILPIKVSTDGKLYTSDIIEAINYIVYYDKADVINMSYGGYGYSEAEYLAVEAANKENIISVAAAGNDNINNEFYPAAFDNTISISSVDPNLIKSDFSNYGSTITFAAPGGNILSINGIASGTSMASPHAASAVAILKSYNENITLKDTIELLKRYAIDLGDKGYDTYYGYGLVSFKGAEFYDGTNGDKYNIFKDNYEYDDDSESSVYKIEPANSTYSVVYNYGNITNLMNVSLKVYYNENNYYTRKLSEIDGIEIIGYQANNKTEQTITIKYKNKETILIVDNTYNLDGWDYKILDNNNISITKLNYNSNVLNSYPVKIYIPEEYDGYKVTELGSKIFNKCMVKSVIIPGTVTNIENSFENSFLENVYLTEGLLNIGYNAFYNTNIKSIIIPNTVTEIGSAAFYDTPLENVVLSENLVEIGGSAFYETRQLKSIKLNNKLEIIGNAAFFNSGIEFVEIPSSVTKIDGYAFYRCKNLKNIILKDGLIEIGERAFQLTNLESIYIPKTVTKIGIAALSQVKLINEIKVDENNEVYDSRNNCNAIIETETNTLIVGCDTTIIPSTVKIIGDSAFSGLTEEIVIPEGVEEIKGYAFCGFSYTGFSKIVLPKSLKIISPNAFKTITYDDISGHIEYPENLVIWVYYGSYAHTYVKFEEVAYMCMDPEDVLIHYLKRTTYKAFERVDTEGFAITLSYEDGRTEIIDENITISYINGNDSFRFGDTYFNVSVYNELGILVEDQIEVTVEKAIPEYIVPIDITATEGQVLSEIKLPDGFEWMDSTQVYDSTNTKIYKAKFVPNDISNYEIVEDIEITIYSESNIGTYIVEHYKENLDGTYTLVEMESHEKAVGATIIVDVNEYEGFTSPIPIQVTIEEGEKTLTYNYTRNSYNVTIINGEGIKQSIGNGTYKYEQEVNLSAIMKDGYKDIVWSGDYTTNKFTMPAKDVSIEVRAIKSPSVSYRSHVQNIGWENSWKYNGGLSGTVGKCLRLEGLQVCLHDKPYAGTIQYRSHVQTVGWESVWKTDSQVSGSVGKSLRVEAIQIKLTDEMAKHYDIYYRLQIQDYGWLGWAKNGQSAGSEGHSKKVEAIEIKIVRKGEEAPGSTDRRFVRASGLKYRSHVQNVGWMPYVDEKGLSGTSGRGLRVEAFQLKLTTTQYDGGIRYRGNIQNNGWESWKYDKQESGTNGKSLRMEAFQIELYGDVANYYDVYYRVHVQNIGWMGWAKNGQSAGTSGYGYRIESFQIQLVDKGGQAPGSTADAFRSK